MRLDFIWLEGIKNYFIILKGSVHHEDITILNMYAPSYSYFRILTEPVKNIDG